MLLLPRSIGPLAIAALGLSAWLHARGICALVGAQLAAPCVAPPLPVVTPSGALPTRGAEIILARNPFDSTTGPLAPDPVLPLPGVPGCDGVQVLAIAAADPPGASLALIRFAGDLEPQLRGVGGEVVSIDPAVVLVDRDGVICAARMFRPALAPPAAAASSGSPRSAAGRVPAGVAVLGPAAFAVDRAARDALLEGAADWMKTVSVRPEKLGGEVVGLRVVGVAAGSPVEGLGIHAGDVLQSVNGVPLTTPERMLEALGRLRTSARITVGVVRAGHELQVDYDVR